MCVVPNALRQTYAVEAMHLTSLSSRRGGKTARPFFPSSPEDSESDGLLNGQFAAQVGDGAPGDFHPVARQGAPEFAAAGGHLPGVQR